MNFMEIANQRIEDIERPKNLPVGTYLCQVSKIPEKGEVSNGRYETLDFTFKIIQAVDVDDEALSDYGDVSSQTLRHRFMFDTEDENRAKRSAYNLRTFLTDHLKAEGETVNEALDSCVGCRCNVEVKWRPDPNNPEVQYVEVKKTAPEA